MKSTLKRELKAREIVEGEAFETRLVLSSHPRFCVVRLLFTGQHQLLRVYKGFDSRFGGGPCIISPLRLRHAIHGCWRNGFQRPVLKHGLGSQAVGRAFECQTRMRNKSEQLGASAHRRPILKTRMDLSMSLTAWTRKVVIYA